MSRPFRIVPLLRLTLVARHVRVPKKESQLFHVTCVCPIAVTSRKASRGPPPQLDRFLDVCLLSTISRLSASLQIRIVAGETGTAVNWAEMDFRLVRVREGSHKDCWLMETAVVRDSGYDTK